MPTIYPHTRHNFIFQHLHITHSSGQTRTYLTHMPLYLNQDAHLQRAKSALVLLHTIIKQVVLFAHVLRVMLYTKAMRGQGRESQGTNLSSGNLVSQQNVQ